MVLSPLEVAIPRLHQRPIATPWDSVFKMAAALVAELTKLVAEVKTVLAATKALHAEAKTVKTASEKPVKKVKSDEAKTPRDSTPSFMARNAYGKVLRARYAERYAADKAVSISHLKTQKDLIDEDKATYDTFCGAFIAELETTGIPASRWKKDDEEYAAFEDAFISNMGSSNAAPKKAAAAAAAPPVKILAKKAKTAPAPPKTPEADESLLPLTVGGEDYLRDSSSNHLWKVDEDGAQGAFAGIYQPGNKKEPIHFCDSPSE